MQKKYYVKQALNLKIQDLYDKIRKFSLYKTINLLI